MTKNAIWGLAAVTALALTFPKPVGFVNDFAGILSDQTRTSLESDLAAFERETTAEISVVTVKSLEGETVEEYAVRLFEDWKIGKKDQDNGVLLLVAPEERKVRIEVGYGLEPIITDGRAGTIIRDKITPAFKAGDYDRGIKDGVGALVNYIRSGTPPSEEEKRQEAAAGSSFPVFLVVPFLILVYLSSFFARSKKVWPGGLLGGILGAIFGAGAGIVVFILAALGFALFGFLLDFILSRNYKRLKDRGLPTGFFSTWGGFSSGSHGGGGGGFGGFGGGHSGGGGSSGSW